MVRQFLLKSSLRRLLRQAKPGGSSCSLLLDASNLGGCTRQKSVHPRLNYRGVKRTQYVSKKELSQKHGHCCKQCRPPISGSFVSLEKEMVFEEEQRST